MTVYKTSIKFCSSSKRNQRHTQNIQDAFPRNALSVIIILSDKMELVLGKDVSRDIFRLHKIYEVHIMLLG